MDSTNPTQRGTNITDTGDEVARSDDRIEVIDVDIDEICHAIATGRGLAELAASPSYTVSTVPSGWPR